MSYVLTRGFGDQQSAQQAVSYGSAGASSAVAAAAAAHLIPAAAVPFIGPAIAGVAILASMLIKNSGCGQTCIVTSQWANQAEDALRQNLQAYRSQQVHTRASQTLALQTFDSIWARLVQMCSDPQWGDAGRRCISDREQGACKWKDAGACWNWFVGYRDPIANDPDVVEDSAVEALGLPLPGLESGSLLPLALIGGLILAGVLL